MRLVSRLTRFDFTKYKICGYLYVDNKGVESILLKLETSCTVILPSMASVLCPSTSSTYSVSQNVFDTIICHQIVK